MARRTIVVGINQTIMAALSMVTIAALIDAPGLGQIVLQALETLDVGTAFNAGLAIVIMAIVLDRVDHGGVGAQRDASGVPAVAAAREVRRPGIVVGGVVTAVAGLPVVHLRVGGGVPGVDGRHRSRSVRGSSTAVPRRANWVQHSTSLGSPARSRTPSPTTGCNPLQALLDELAVLADRRRRSWPSPAILGGLRAAVWAAVCLGLLVAARPVAGLHGHAGLDPGRHRPGDAARCRRRRLDGPQQTRGPDDPAGARRGADDAAVRLSGAVPGAVRQPSRFTAIVAGSRVRRAGRDQDHRRRHPGRSRRRRSRRPRSAGSSTWQIITKVQLPMSAHRRAWRPTRA